MNFKKMVKILPIFYSFFIIVLIKNVSVKCQQNISNFFQSDNIENLSTDENQKIFLSTFTKFQYNQDLNSDDLKIMKRKVRATAIVEFQDASGSGDDLITSTVDVTIGQEDYTTVLTEDITDESKTIAYFSTPANDIVISTQIKADFTTNEDERIESLSTSSKTKSHGLESSTKIIQNPTTTVLNTKTVEVLITEKLSTIKSDEVASLSTPIIENPTSFVLDSTTIEIMRIESSSISSSTKPDKVNASSTPINENQTTLALDSLSSEISRTKSSSSAEIISSTFTSRVLDDVELYTTPISQNLTKVLSTATSKIKTTELSSIERSTITSTTRILDSVTPSPTLIIDSLSTEIMDDKKETIATSTVKNLTTSILDFTVLNTETTEVTNSKQDFIKSTIPMYTSTQISLNDCIFIGCECNDTSISCTNKDDLPKRIKKKEVFIENLTMCKIKNLYHLPDSYFNGLSFGTLTITKNRNLVRLFEDSFKGVVNLKRLFLTRNKISQLDYRVFDPLGEIEIDELSLELNSLQSFHYLFKFPRNLKTLNLAGNQISTLDQRSFSEMNQLKVLNLQANSINSINANQFQILTSLEKLDLKYNSIQFIDMYWLKNSSNTIKFLILDNNRLFEMGTGLNQIFTILNSLEDLRLKSNRLNFIPNVNYGLKSLNCAKNEIKDLTSIRNLPETLLEFDLSSNLISQIKSNSFSNLKNLASLNMENNRLSILEKNAFNQLFMLKKLNLKGNYLKSLPTDNIYNLVSLHYIDLSFQDYPGIKLNIIDDYAFDRNQTLAKELGIISLDYTSINLRGNPVTYFGKRAFCSLNHNNHWIHIENLDLQETNIYNLNPCLMQQLSANRNSTSSKIIFNTNDTIKLNCDCDIFEYLKSNQVFLNGNCLNENNQTDSVDQKQVCGAKSKINCIKFKEYNCDEKYDKRNETKYWYSGKEFKYKSNETFSFSRANNFEILDFYPIITFTLIISYFQN
jgi:hypothetical protein